VTLTAADVSIRTLAAEFPVLTKDVEIGAFIFRFPSQRGRRSLPLDSSPVLAHSGHLPLCAHDLRKQHRIDRSLASPYVVSRSVTTGASFVSRLPTRGTKPKWQNCLVRAFAGDVMSSEGAPKEDATREEWLPMREEWPPATREPAAPSLEMVPCQHPFNIP
jgi:hypothetical protein